jgi:hypothetical protein
MLVVLTFIFEVFGFSLLSMWFACKASEPLRSRVIGQKELVKSAANP